MAKQKDVVFSSEKLESQERLKRILIPIAALLIIVALVVVVALVVRSSRGVSYSGGEDTEYPYSWKNSSKGIMTLEIDHSAAPGYSWITLNTEPQNIVVAATEKQPKDKSSFTLTPSGEGRYNTFFLLYDENGSDEAAAKLDMLLETTSNAKGVLQTTVLSSSIQKRQVQTARGEGTYFPYSYRADTDGFIVLTVNGGDVVDDWQAACDNEDAADYAGPFCEDGNAIFYIVPGSVPGTCNAAFSSEKGAVKITLVLELGEDGTLLVSSDSMEGGDTEPAFNTESEES